ncbi:alpha/beta hydrolase [Bacteroides sp. 224]|uniref:alpha/beta hydrolase n=1 Tax=Bacteroides sp. 224 TaxID=2302936 RepID=UPI0013D2D993|nr:alpha/beta hydrolase [Bacteroides sp. 224]NDV64500.1 alpha/beta hydrolase [Bacteroides sp. 224]
MKKIAYLVILPLLFGACKSAQPTDGKGVSKEEASAYLNTVYPKWLEAVKEENAKAWEEKVFVRNGKKMPIDYKIIGEAPADGRSLFISLHGGGNTAPAVNDQQWRNQIRLYTPKEGVYVAPRAPWDDWNMWFKPGIDSLYDAIIQTAVTLEGVNPNKVYLLGYSAGGDGLYRMAPRMADRWAAASMMAGHPGEASQVNLRNLPFMIWMGEKDGAYNRNKLAAVCGQRLDSLQRLDPENYIHETHIVKGKGHWMERADTVAITWMEQYKRNPYPDKVVWRQENVVLPALYWLSVPLKDAKHTMEVVVTRSGNTINIEKNDYPELTIHLNDEMFNLDKPITLQYQGTELYKGKVARTLANIEEELNARGDKYYAFPAKLTVLKNSKVVSNK